MLTSTIAGFSSWLLTIAAMAVFSAIWFVWHVKKQKNGIPPLPPGPRGLPVVGYLPFLGENLHREYTQLAGVHGPIYKLWLGNKLSVVISSPSIAKEIVRDKDTIFVNRDPPIAAQILSFGQDDIAWSNYGPHWKNMRKIFVREMMSDRNLDACYALRRQEVRKVVSDVHNRIGKPIDVGRLVFAASTNSVLRMVGGGTLRDEKWRDFSSHLRDLAAESMVLMAKPNISDLFPVFARLDLQGVERRARKVQMSIEAILDSAIEQYLHKDKEAEKTEKRKDFLQILFDLVNQVDGTSASFTMNELKGMLMDVVIGGTDTTATMIEWVMAELMLHLEIREKVRQELENVVGLDNIVEESHLPKLHYLEAVVKETFRLHPALPLLVPRHSNQSTVVGGYTIPKSTTVFLNVYAIHRDPQLWEKPLEFKPDRFLNDSSGKFEYLGNNFDYLPFGSGRRVCPGIPLAEKILMYVLASLLHSFHWKLTKGTELELSEKLGIVVKKLKPLILIPSHRLSNMELY